MKACIFDLDGTLLDSMGVWRKVDVCFFNKRGFDVPENYENEIAGLSFTEAAVYTKKRFALPESTDDILREWKTLAQNTYANDVRLKPYAKEYLAKLKERGVKLAIATSSTASLYEPALKNHGVLDWFSAITTSEEVSFGKSRPDVFLLTARKLCVNPRECVVFEDLLMAVETAKAAGFIVCGVYEETAKKDWERIKKTADYAVESFERAPLF